MMFKTVNEIKNDSEQRMKKSVETLNHSLVKLRTGRAHPSLLDSIEVLYYGNPTPLNQVANVTVEDARTLSISPWEKSLTQAIDKAIRSSDLGLNPVAAGTVIRVPLPPLTEERRKDLVKHVRGEIEEAKVAVRNIRRDANANIKELHKSKILTEDDVHKAEDSIQKITDKFIAEIDKIFVAKEAELMHV
ncbi:MAG: ribosome recycling factor [Gammaproteobacteria bacterium]